MESLKDFKKISDGFNKTGIKMPMLFIGHGSPMNAIEDNEFSVEWKNISKGIPKPRAVLCISAHWETNGTFVTAMEKPRTIHDFYGFPKELFNVEYPADGAPEIASETKNLIGKTNVEFDNKWGFDHGSWSILKHIYPAADVRVIELSIDHYKPPRWHYELAKEISSLREKGILIIGSGNIVHNLGMLNWNNPDDKYDWSEEMNNKFKSFIKNNDHDSLINYSSLGKAAELAVPTPEHFIPLLYILGLKGDKDEIEFFNDKTVMGSISMTSLKFF